MTHTETLRLALEYVELVPDDRYNAEHIDQDALITAIKAALEAKDEPIQKQIIKLKTVDEPCNQVMALGQMMRDWLQSQIADSNTSVDVGKGFSEFDLWVQCEGKELFITIKEKND